MPRSSGSSGAEVLQRAKLCAVIPSLNEEATIGSVIESLKHLNVVPIVIDDGSWDDTGKIAEQTGAILIKHSQNKGTGFAIKTGYVYAKNSFDDESIVLVVAGDGQHRVSDTPNLIQEILANKADYVVGERFSRCPKEFGIPALNYVFGKILNRLSWMIIGIDVKDCTCGFTAIRMTALKRLKLDLPARAAETIEMLQECSKNNIRVSFVPVTPIYGRKSKISKFTFLIDILKVYFRAMVSEPRSASVFKVLMTASKIM